ncbi:hypothetical protein K5X82_03430 [Halosquirtibacter xylanolyticus]|uniref:hypothetical protein n=1 Tax=Halosquirtibacter xylanolyticus TaxID=3374599 RepID=UPI00374843B5|nr:hypothetical protein K5X82_03430 [Prolixibacteraceae bacterium]
MNKRRWEELEKEKPFPELRSVHLKDPNWTKIDRWLNSLNESELMSPSEFSKRRMRQLVYSKWDVV